MGVDTAVNPAIMADLCGHGVVVTLVLPKHSSRVRVPMAALFFSQAGFNAIAFRLRDFLP